MKDKINRFIDWFEDKFNFIVDITALIGSIFTILLSIYVFIIMLIDADGSFFFMESIVLPGAIGFMAIIMLFALRITRHLTKKD